MIGIILLIGLVLRLINLNQSLWLDEAINVLATQKYSFVGMITEYAKADFHPFGYFILSWIWTHLFGISEVIIRTPSVLFAVVSIYLTFLIGKKLHSNNLGLLSALLLAINPLHMFYSQEARMYSLAAMAVLLNLLFFIKIIKNEKVMLIYLILSNVLIFSADYVSYLIFPAQLTFLLFSRKKEIFKTWIKGVFFALLIVSPGIPIFLSQLDVGSVASANLPTWKFVVGGFDIKAIPLTLVKFIIGRISMADKTLYGVVILPICLLFLFLIFRGFKFLPKWERNLLTCWLIIPIFLGSIISLAIPIYSYFRFLFTVPSFIILVSAGIISLKSKFKYTALATVLLIQIFCTFTYLLNNSFHREDWRGLVAYLKTRDENYLVLFESSGTLPPFDYYAKGTLNAKGALRDFPAKNENDVIFSDLLDKPKDVYLVQYLVHISDPGHLVDEALKKNNYKVVETKDFHGVGFLYHYQKQ